MTLLTDIEPTTKNHFMVGDIVQSTAKGGSIPTRVIELTMKRGKHHIITSDLAQRFKVSGPAKNFELVARP